MHACVVTSLFTHIASICHWETKKDCKININKKTQSLLSVCLNRRWIWHNHYGLSTTSLVKYTRWSWNKIIILLEFCQIHHEFKHRCTKILYSSSWLTIPYFHHWLYDVGRNRMSFMYSKKCTYKNCPLYFLHYKWKPWLVYMQLCAMNNNVFATSV